MNNKPTIGFIGQGYIGKNYADDFEERGYETVRYALEEPYRDNKEKLTEVDILFVAVPTPTTPGGFDDSIVRDVISLAKAGDTVVVKSTVLPGTTDAIQKEHPDKVVLFSPEFLSAKTAAEDARHPIMNIVGVSGESSQAHEAAKRVLAMLPESPHTQLCSAREAELIKYMHNVHGYFRVMFANLMYDAADAFDCRWEEIRKAMDADPFLSTRAPYYNNPVHKSGHGSAAAGRGAGGPCFIKDLAAFVSLYESSGHDPAGVGILRALEKKNRELLELTGKDGALLEEVYGKKEA